MLLFAQHTLGLAADPTGQELFVPQRNSQLMAELPWQQQGSLWAGRRQFQQETQNNPDVEPCLECSSIPPLLTSADPGAFPVLQGQL